MEEKKRQSQQGAANAMSPAVESPKPAAAAVASPNPSAVSPAAAASPQPDAADPFSTISEQKGFTGKFNHKLIAKKATTATAKLQPLGSDINIPGKSKFAAAPALASAHRAADPSTKPATSSSKRECPDTYLCTLQH